MTHYYVFRVAPDGISLDTDGELIEAENRSEAIKNHIQEEYDREPGPIERVDGQGSWMAVPTPEPHFMEQEPR